MNDYYIFEHAEMECICGDGISTDSPDEFGTWMREHRGCSAPEHDSLRCGAMGAIGSIALVVLWAVVTWLIAELFGGPWGFVEAEGCEIGACLLFIAPFMVMDALGR